MMVRDEEWKAGDATRVAGILDSCDAVDKV